MPATANLTSLAAILKTLYPQTAITAFMYENAPFLAMVPKATDFKGEIARIACRYSATQGRSADISTAITNKTAASYAKWSLTRSKDYSLFQLDGETIRAAKDKGAIVDGVAGEVDAAMDSIKRATQIDVFRNGGGARGKGNGSYSVGGAEVTLSEPSDIVNFEAGMVLQMASTDGTSGSVRSGTITVLSVNRGDGKFTATGNITAGIAAAVNTDYFFQGGDFGLKLKGLDAWLPATAPTSGDSFFGLDRSVDTDRLAGIRLTGSGLAIEEALQKLATRIGREGGKPSHCFMNNEDFLNLVLSLGTRVYYVDEKTDVDVGFSGVRVIGPTGPIKVFADPNCPKGVAYMLQMDKWKLWSLGAMPGFLGDDGDGLKFLRSTTADSYEGRIGYYAQLYCTAPGYNGRITLPV